MPQIVASFVIVVNGLWGIFKTLMKQLEVDLAPFGGFDRKR
jgi:hypothetical protein